MLYNSSRARDRDRDTNIDAAESEDDETGLPNRELPKTEDEAVQYAHVLEVFKDEVSELRAWTLDAQTGEVERRDSAREGMSSRNREQRWGAFVLSANGVGFRDPFYRAEKEKSTLHVIKQFPFGRRP